VWLEGRCIGQIHLSNSTHVGEFVLVHVPTLLIWLGRLFRDARLENLLGKGGRASEHRLWDLRLEHDVTILAEPLPQISYIVTSADECSHLLVLSA
jgi:hypothetical protein